MSLTSGASTASAPHVHSSGYQPWLHRYACLTALCTLVLICAGGLVTSTDSGLAVPDWPLSYGTLFPPMVGGILIEHTHRLIAATVGLLVLILCGWLLKREPRRFVRRLGIIALAAVILQGLLGGLNVLWLQPKAILLGHACLAQGFFCVVVSIALFTSREWHEPLRERGSSTGALHGLTLGCVAVVFLQLILGAVVRHFNAGTAIPDFPLMLGRIIPPLDDPQVLVHFLHRLGAVVVATVLVTTAIQILRRHADNVRLLAPARMLVLALVTQLTLGAVTVLTKTAATPTTAHVAVGAFILALCLVLTLRVHRYLAKPAHVIAPTLVSTGAAT